MVEKLVGKITHYFGNIGVGIVKLEKGEIKIGSKIKIKTHEGEFEQEVVSMQADHKDIVSAKAGEEFGTKLEQKAHEGNEVFLME
jgi:putative protease